jgi:hypothetical protein
MLEKMALMERVRQLQRLREEEEGEQPPQQAAQQHEAHKQQEQQPAPLVTFTPSVELNDVVKPHDRSVTGMHGRHCKRLCVWHII